MTTAIDMAVKTSPETYFQSKVDAGQKIEPKD